MVSLLRRLRLQGGSDFCHFVRSACGLVCPGCEGNRPALPVASSSFLPWGCCHESLHAWIALLMLAFVRGLRSGPSSRITASPTSAW
eukprot:5877622-Amphidinium_carterae.2